MSTTVASGSAAHKNELPGLQWTVWTIVISGIIELDMIPTSMRLI